MPRLFGTDGVRGVANDDLTPDLALALGRAAGRALAPGGTIVVGRDTRISGPMLEGALVAGLCSAGTDVLDAGCIPTPAVAYLTRRTRSAAGAVISASHNPVADNGIKFFSRDGLKIAAQVEDDIEDLMSSPSASLPTGEAVGKATTLEDAEDLYIGHLRDCLEHRLAGLRIVLDCAFGAAWRVAPRAFEAMGADVVAIHDEPDGSRINVDCGSTSMGALAKAVEAEEADFGLAFDGDADRVLAVDEQGEMVNGDQILALWALRLHEIDALDNGVVVTTVMANLAFKKALERRGIEVVTAPVGDRFVAEAMADTSAVLGGEQSGHIIFGRYSTTGDGILTGLKVAEAVASAARPLSELTRLFHPYPQVLINVRVASRDGLDEAAGLWDEVRAVEDALGDDGRVLVRPSGTEALIRVLVEARDESVARRSAETLVAAVRRHVG